ncbi:FAD-dependent oxidoreductase [Lentisphaerota bacterium WC36G]|nr:FAD-dependent oxidoreductase [Lentisphaerae bacterium WC36]
MDLKQLSLNTKKVGADFCVVGGGMAGVCAALAAARNGVKTVLVQDRSVLGGNASSEVRMWICGAHGSENKETGIIEELQLENIFTNESLNFNVWDHVIYGKCLEQENLQVILNCSVYSLEMTDDNKKIAKVNAWHTHEQCFYEISAKLFADCSGDSILRLSGADYRCGREARDEFNEAHAPEKADDFTMGNSILIQIRKTNLPHREFTAPEWAHHYTDETAPKRELVPTGHNFWWLEIGGMQNTLLDCDNIRDELLKIAYGVWEYIKNHPDGRGHDWELDWIGSIPGKRENVRYMGDVILNQNDVEAEGKHFDDIVAFGGWPMDDHHPEAIHYPGEPTIFHYAPSPFGIPYRCLYSRNIDNLLFAGRNISTTHMAMSSTRVMGTTSIMGQAIGTAAAIAVRDSLTPREVYSAGKMVELQNTLMDQDCYIPWHARKMSDLTKNAALISSNGNDVTAIRNGIERSLDGVDNGWWGNSNDYLEYSFDKPVEINGIRLLFDSDLTLEKRMLCRYEEEGFSAEYPKMMSKEFMIEAKFADSDEWKTVKLVTNNKQRLVNFKNLNLKNVVGCRLKLLKMHDENSAGHVFSFDFL